MSEISVAEAAERTGNSEPTIRRWAQAGKIGARKVGKRAWLVDEQTVPVTIRLAPAFARAHNAQMGMLPTHGGLMDRILEQLHVAVALARVERDRRDRSDPAGRMISLAITDMESAENWLERAQRSDGEEARARAENPA